MKTNSKNLFFNSMKIIMMLIAFSFAVASCTPEEEPVVPPVTTVSVATLNGAPGAALTATVNAEAKGGLSAIKI
jgi:hypothetical protein